MLLGSNQGGARALAPRCRSKGTPLRIPRDRAAAVEAAGEHAAACPLGRRFATALRGRRRVRRRSGASRPAGRPTADAAARRTARLAGDQATKTLAHECAHHIAGTRAGVNMADAETIAEGAAFVVLHHCGIDTGGYTFPYVAHWAANRAVLTRNLEAIRATAYTLIHVATGGTGAALDAAA